MNSRVYPTYKTKYRVANWPSYDRALIGRGDVTLWVSPEAIATWEPAGVGTRGGQRQYSDVAIETALTLRLLFHLPLRQTEGFLHSLFGMMGLDLAAPDHTTLSRRGQRLDLACGRVPPGQGLHLIVDSTGLAIMGEGEWAQGEAWRTRDARLEEAPSGCRPIGCHHRPRADRGHCRRRDDGHRTDQSRRRRPCERHGGRGLRHDRLLRCCGRAWRDRRGATGQDGKGISTEAAVERSRSRDSEGAGGRTTTVEEGIGLPSAGPRGERLLPVQVDHRGWPSSAQSGRAGD